jgi:alanyl-tRNA synthetase
MKIADIRQKFLNYFNAQGHQIVASSSLVPANDPTLLFTNAGMVQFKDLFLGNEVRTYNRATTSQRCVRAGGKHNDLENVGYTARHHTFFEMLGNFSFGDYFKRDAIRFAWEFLTKELQLPADKLWVTVFHEDDEAAAIWINEVGVDPKRLSRLGEKDNFWAMGDTGPCGPCTEIFYDHGPEVAGGPPGSPDDDGDRYIEIWNLVFMQFDRQPDGTLVRLPKPSVDTGMGLERLAAVLQHVHSNYEIDLFQGILRAAAEITGTTDTSNTSLRVIADHIRSCSFLVADGVLPSNEGRGYVLRRIIRRAVRHGYQLGVKDIFFYRLVDALVQQMGEAYPELKSRQEFVERVLREEEQQFARTLENGMAILKQAITELNGSEIPGDTVFKLYDTFGFPVDLTADVAREQALTLDMAGFDRAMAVQKQQARAASHFNAVEKLVINLEQGTRFTGYEQLVSMGDFSTELCGGTHVDRTGDIGLFKFVSESGIAAGVRRIEAVTGLGALAIIERQEILLKQLCEVAKANQDSLLEKVQQMMTSNRALEREIEQLKVKLAGAAGSDIASETVTVKGASLLVKTVDGFNAKTLRDTVDQLKNKLGSSVVVLASIEDDKVSIVAGVSKDLVESVRAGDLVNMVATQIGGKGGGRADMAMAGGSDLVALPAALASIREWLEARL